MARIGSPNSRRCSRARACKVCSASSTTIRRSALSGRVFGSEGSSTTSYAAPFSRASAAKRLPSNDAPRSAKNTESGSMRRESVEMRGWRRYSSYRDDIGEIEYLVMFSLSKRRAERLSMGNPARGIYLFGNPGGSGIPRRSGNVVALKYVCRLRCISLRR